MYSLLSLHRRFKRVGRMGDLMKRAEHCIVHWGTFVIHVTDEPKPATIAAGGDCRWPLGADGPTGVIEQVHPIAVPIANGERQARDAVIDKELMKRATADQHVDALGRMLLIEHHAL